MTLVAMSIDETQWTSFLEDEMNSSERRELFALVEKNTMQTAFDLELQCEKRRAHSKPSALLPKISNLLIVLINIDFVFNLDLVFIFILEVPTFLAATSSFLGCNQSVSLSLSSFFLRPFTRSLISDICLFIASIALASFWALSALSFTKHSLVSWVQYFPLESLQFWQNFLTLPLFCLMPVYTGRLALVPVSSESVSVFLDFFEASFFLSLSFSLKVRRPWSIVSKKAEHGFEKFNLVHVSKIDFELSVDMGFVIPW